MVGSILDLLVLSRNNKIFRSVRFWLRRYVRIVFLLFVNVKQIMINVKQIEEKIDELKGFVNLLEKIFSEVQKIEEKSSSDDLVGLEKKAKEIEKKISDIEKLINDPPEGFSEIFELKDWLELKKQDIEEKKKSSQFASDLSRSLKKIDLKLEGNIKDGLKVGFLKLKLNIARDQVDIIYGTDKEDITQCPIRVSAVKPLIEKYLKQDKLGSGIPVDKLFDYIKEAYARVARKESPSPEGIPINHLLPELAILIQDQKFHENPTQENYRSYTRINYSYDLFRLRTTGYLAQGLKLRSASKAYTEQKKGICGYPNLLIL